MQTAGIVARLPEVAKPGACLAQPCRGLVDDEGRDEDKHGDNGCRYGPERGKPWPGQDPASQDHRQQQESRGLKLHDNGKRGGTDDQCPPLSPGILPASQDQ